MSASDTPVVCVRREWLASYRHNFTPSLSQLELAQKLGICQQFVSAVERGLNRPSVELAKRWGKYLGFDWILFYEDSQSDIPSRPDKVTSFLARKRLERSLRNK
ncbi:hypothetical protein FACS1894188_01270 [Clostridia bacterium]|nr:hypothetical protein FACS1894188_01270 [Clostridia bacterium]